MSTVSAFWADREVSLAEAARTVSAVLQAVAAIDPLLAGWRRGGGSLKQAMRQPELDVSAASLESLLKIYRNDEREPMPDLGFHFDAWNGAAEYPDQTSVSVAIGLHAANPNLSNAFVVNLPKSWSREDSRVDQLVRVDVELLAPDEVVYFGTGSPERQVLWRAT
jgi:hypothetical protein